MSLWQRCYIYDFVMVVVMFVALFLFVAVDCLELICYFWICDDDGGNGFRWRSWKHAQLIWKTTLCWTIVYAIRLGCSRFYCLSLWVYLCLPVYVFAAYLYPSTHFSYCKLLSKNMSYESKNSPSVPQSDFSCRLNCPWLICSRKCDGRRLHTCGPALVTKYSFRLVVVLKSPDMLRNSTWDLSGLLEFLKLSWKIPES